MELLVKNLSFTNVPCVDSKFFISFPFLFGEFNEIGVMIEKNGYFRPNSKEILDIIYHAYLNPYSLEGEKIFECLRSSSLLEYSLGLHLPKSKEEINDGVIIDHNPPLIIDDLLSYKKSLIEKIYEKDDQTVFVPFGYSVGMQSLSQLSKNPYFIGRYGEENVDKFFEIHSIYDDEPCIYSYRQVNELILNKFAIREDFGLLNIYSKNLTMDGSKFKNNDVGYGIGISYDH